jgi:hypothetical protein
MRINGFKAELITARQFLLRVVVRTGSWAAGLILAAWAVPGVSLSKSAIAIAVLCFSISQTCVSFWILKLPHGYASLLLGSTGLVLTVAAIGVASLSSHGFGIRGPTSWLATTVVVWLVTTIGAILSFDVYLHTATRAT